MRRRKMTVSSAVFVEPQRVLMVIQKHGLDAKSAQHGNIMSALAYRLLKRI